MRWVLVSMQSVSLFLGVCKTHADCAHFARSGCLWKIHLALHLEQGCHCLKLSSSSSSILNHEQGSTHQSMSVLAVQCLPSPARTRESIWGLENHESFETKMQKDSSINISMFCNQLLYSLIVIQLLGKLMRSPGCVKAPELWCTDFRACGGVATLNPSHMG